MLYQFLRQQNAVFSCDYFPRFSHMLESNQNPVSIYILEKVLFPCPIS